MPNNVVAFRPGRTKVEIEELAVKVIGLAISDSLELCAEPVNNSASATRQITVTTLEAHRLAREVRRRGYWDLGRRIEECASNLKSERER